MQTFPKHLGSILLAAFALILSAGQALADEEEGSGPVEQRKGVNPTSTGDAPSHYQDSDADGTSDSRELSTGITPPNICFPLPDGTSVECYDELTFYLYLLNQSPYLLPEM